MSCMCSKTEVVFGCVRVHGALKESPNSLMMRLKVHHRVNLKLERELELY